LKKEKGVPKKPYIPINKIKIEGKIRDGIQAHFNNEGSSGSNEFNFNLKSGTQLFHVRFTAKADYLEEAGIKDGTFVLIEGELKEEQGDAYISALLMYKA